MTPQACSTLQVNIQEAGPFLFVMQAFGAGGGIKTILKAMIRILIHHVYVVSVHVSHSKIECILTDLGPGGTETGSWAIAAGMKDFDTYSKKCRYELRDENKWPDGIASVDLGSGKPVMRGDQMHSPLSREGLPRG